MRSILVDHARARQAAKRGAAATKLPLKEALTLADAQSEELLSLDEALKRLADIDPRQARIVELRYFAGMTVPEVAGLLDVSERTVMRDWNVAKAWLHGEVRKKAEASYSH
jgi:RNA polymerase sigma factor (TIGR02999 family)